jgi:succinyl-diaminopimelate desuccinylase
VHRLAPVLSAISSWPVRQVTIDGCAYRESLQAVNVVGGVASNVLPDFVGLEINYRFAPDRDVMAASRVVRELLEPYLEEADTFAVTDSAPAARPWLDHPVLARLARLVSAVDGGVRAKLGWTDVAFFAERGVPAANFGPGDPEAAHSPGESVTRASLEQARRALGQLLGV